MGRATMASLLPSAEITEMPAPVNFSGKTISKLFRSVDYGERRRVRAINGPNAANIFLAGRKFSDSRDGYQLHRKHSGSGLYYRSLPTARWPAGCWRVLVRLRFDADALTHPAATTPCGFGGPPLPTATPAASSWILVVIGQALHHALSDANDVSAA